jgi:hypothetical protein
MCLGASGILVVLALRVAMGEHDGPVRHLIVAFNIGKLLDFASRDNILKASST